MTDSTHPTHPAGPKRRRPPFPWFGREQLWITLSLIVVMIATMLPWFTTFLGNRPGVDGWGFLAFWGAAVGLTGAFSIRERMFRVVPVLGAAIAVGIVVWMTIDSAAVCSPGPDGSAPCRPGIGLILAGAAAINALLWSVRSFRMWQRG